MNILSYVIVLFYALEILGSPVKIQPLVVNGSDASIEQFPFQVSIQLNGNHLCGGTILNNNWILTAAHCVQNMKVTELSVLLGTTYLTQGGITIGVSTFIIHASFNPEDAYKNDIAVIKLSQSLTLSSTIQPVTLPSQSQYTPAGLTATLIGWGLLYNDGLLSDVLQQVDLLTYSDTECEQLLYGYPHAHNICAGVPGGGKGQCSGDSGGPLLVKGVQIGIVSWAPKPCTEQDYPEVYTEVSYFISWINRNIV